MRFFSYGERKDGGKRSDENLTRKKKNEKQTANSPEQLYTTSIIHSDNILPIMINLFKLLSQSTYFH